MKKKGTALLAMAFSFMSIATFAQDRPKEQKIPPINELPKKGEVKTFYEFDKPYEFKLFNAEGKFSKKGNKQFLDVTDLPKGTYFFQYNGKKVLYKKD